LVKIFHITKVTRVTSRPQNWCKPQGAKGNERSLKVDPKVKLKVSRNTLERGKVTTPIYKKKKNVI
jgi:hypothetical protein